MSTVAIPYPTVDTGVKEDLESFSPLRLVVPLLFSVAGTGGFLTAQNSAEALSRYYYPYVQVESPSTQSYESHSPAERVARIRDVFAINMSDLAALLGVTRPTVYAWLEGQEPTKSEALRRIRWLARTADVVEQANIPRLDKLIRRPVVEGRSLLDLLKAGEDPHEAIEALKAIANREAQTRRKPKGCGRNLRSLEEALGDASVPIHEGS